MSEKADIKTTPVWAVQAVTRHVESEIPQCTSVYDEQLGFDSGIKIFRNNNNLSTSQQEQMNALREKFISGSPLFLFNRTICRYPEAGQMRRSATYRSIQLDGLEGKLYRSFHGEFDIEFNYLSTSIEEMEMFEVDYMAKAGITRATQLLVCPTKADIGNWTYYLDWEPLESKVLNSDGQYYKAIAGKVTVRGFFFVFVGCSKIINTIGYRIFEGEAPNGTLLSEGEIGG